MHQFIIHSKYTGIAKYMISLALIMVIYSFGPVRLCANTDFQKTLLIVNSYDENEPWSQDMAKTIIMHLSSIPDIGCEMVNLNAALMTCIDDFERTSDAIFTQYSKNPPKYIVLIGSLAFNLTERIKSDWGEVPILLITRNKEYINLTTYFNAAQSSFENNSHSALVSQRDNYNFTSIIISDFYKATIDMMVNLIPDMDRLVFLADSVYLNRKMAHDIREYVHNNYPEITLKWLKANPENTDSFQQYLFVRNKRLGLLLSSWLYEKKAMGDVKIATSTDMRLVSASHNPVFTLKEQYYSLGVIGGTYVNNDKVHQHEIDVVDAMLRGESMKDIPFFFAKEPVPIINYRLLKEYGLDSSKCPPDTHYFNKPLGFWEQYFWEAISAFLVIVILIVMLIKENIDQKRIKAASKRTSEFINNMPIPYSTATVHYDSEGDVHTIDYANKNAVFEKIINENRIQGNPYILFPPEFIVPKIENLLHTHKPQVFQYYFQNTDSFYEFILCFVNEVPERKNKAINKIDIFAKDITEAKRMEKNMSNIATKLDLTLSMAQLIPWQLDMKTNIIKFDNSIRNQHRKTDLTTTDHEVTERYSDYLDRVHPADREKFMKLMNSIRNDRIREFRLEYRALSHKDATTYDWVENIGVVTEYNEVGYPRTIIGSVQIITERVMHERQMQDAMEKATESDRMKSAFLANISHEIRTPLNSIVGFSSVIAETDSKEERLEYNSIIRRNNEQILSIIENIIELAKIESNTIDLEYAPCDLNELLIELDKEMKAKLPKDVNMYLVLGLNKCVIDCDRRRLTEVLHNLLTNAIKFTEHGNITFGYKEAEDNMLYFSITDTGVGVSKEEQENIFNPFVKLDKFVSGVGLGLTICKNIINKMGGEIGMVSEGEGMGSTFWFTIPNIPSEDSEDLGKTKTKSTGLAKTDRKLKILVAEDNTGNFQLIERLLRERADLIHAVDGVEAVRLFGEVTPDLVLMDISMPNMNGIKAFEEIRKISETVPVIAVTAYAYASERKMILDAGFDAYLSKPISKKALYDAIDALTPPQFSVYQTIKKDRFGSKL